MPPKSLIGRARRATTQTSALLALALGATVVAACDDDKDRDTTEDGATGDGEPTDGADGTPVDGEPSDGADGQPADGADGQPADGADGQPADGADGEPTDGADGEPEDGSDGLDGGVDGGELDASVEDGGIDGSVPDGGFPLAPLFRNNVRMQDRALARKALEIMGSPDVGAEGSCSNCHDLGRPTLSKWRNMTQEVDERCFGNTSLSDPAAIDQTLECINWDGDETITPSELGVFSAAAHLPWFEFAYQHRSAADENWQNAHDQFVAHAGMPRRGARLTQDKFDIVAEWFVRGIPYYRDLVPPDRGTATCTNEIKPAMTAHIATMATAGWRSKNRADGMLMYGCQTGDTTLSCLSELELASSTRYGAGWDRAGSKIRVLFDNSAAGSSFWSRSSADGRYIASGGGVPNQPDDGTALGAKIIDLQRGVYIALDGNYDPGFFPDNSGFVMQASGGALTCHQSLLSRNPARIDGSDPECSYLDQGLVGIYEQLAKTVGGDDYWSVYGQYSADDGGYAGQNPDAPFGSDSNMTLTPLINEGNRFRTGHYTVLETPQQGDPSISPSGTLLISRVKGDELEDEWGNFTAKQNGYSIQAIHAQLGEDELTATLEPMARICITGGKPMLSSDERFLVVHQYVTEESFAELGFANANDPAFRRYVDEGTSNLFLVDLKTGAQTRITHMQPGQKALFPHFRSDGWIYFISRFYDEDGASHEIILASDAALVWEASH